MARSKKSKSLPWDLVEKKIQEEMNWLRNAIDHFSVDKVDKNVAITCPECLRRRIAILILSSKIKATEIKKASDLKSFWNIRKGKNSKKIKRTAAKTYHGKEWHRETMRKIAAHFLSRNNDRLVEFICSEKK